MAKVVIDGIEYEVNPDNNLLQEALSQGLDLPYFCWHPCMGSVGACRQCAVKQYRDADDKEGMLVMSCMTPATDGAIFSIEDEQARDMRERVIEGLMISHPHDCPVCEEGGECHLQDMTVMSGHNYRRYDKKKVTHNNQYLGPFINHEMNRCITCYRCVRYYSDYAGGTDLSAQASHHHTYFGRHEEGVLESEFSGNLVEVCPTGVFTDKPFSERYTRKWDLQSAPSVCTGCAVGCNTTPGERYGELRRIVNRYNSEINGYFLCDRGRFGFDYVNGDRRLTTPFKRVDGVETELDAAEVASTLATFRGEGVIGIASPRASNEDNFALRTMVGEDNFFSGVSDEEHEATQLILELAKDKAFNTPSIRDIEQADAVIVIGEDLTNTAPRVALALRQSVHNKALELADGCNIPRWQDAAVRELAQHDRSPLAILSSYATRLDDVASDSIIDSPANLASLGFAVAAQLSDKAPKASTEMDDVAARIAEQLAGAKRPLVISGTGSANSNHLKAAANIARALNARRDEAIDLCLLLPEVNSAGHGLIVNSDNTLGKALAKLESGEASKVVILENDLYRRAAHGAVDKALSAAADVLVIDQVVSATTDQASCVLPGTSFSEQEATHVNYEGRAQLSFQVHRNHKQALPAWRWLDENQDDDVNTLISRCAEQAENFEGLDGVLPDLGRIVAGMKIPRQSHRYSGRTAMKANLDVHEPKQPVDDQSVMSFSMEGVPVANGNEVMGSAWSPGWNSNQAISKFQEEVNGELKQGHVGTMLIERDAVGEFFPTESSNSSTNSKTESGAFALAIAHQIFGSEELSAKAEVIKQRMTGPYISLSPEDAATLGVTQGQAVALNGSGQQVSACIRSKMKPGTVALYCGDNEIDRYSLGHSVTLARGDAADERGIKGLIVSDLFEEDY